MSEFDPHDLAARCGGTWHPTVPDGTVAGFSIDTRALRPGQMFVALRSERRDGHDFLGQAMQAGATAALVSRIDAAIALPQLVVADTLVALQTLAREQRLRFDRPVVAVTGSAGKTSTKDLLAALLGEPGEVLATEGNLNNHLGVPLTLLRLDASCHRAAVVEAGINQRGEMDILGTMIAPDVAVITLVGAAHLEGLGTIEGVAEEKARLAAHVRVGGVAVFPSSCLEQPAFRKIEVEAFVAEPVGRAGSAPSRHFHEVPFAIRHEGAATLLCVTWAGTVEEFELRRVTTGMAANAALAVMVALHLGVTADVLRVRLPRWRPAALRGEILRRDDGRIVYLDCYNANPASMADALEGFLGLAGGEQPRLYVVGCMEELGAQAADLHRATGAQWPLRGGDRLMVFGAYADALAAGVRTVVPGADVLLNPDRAEASAIVQAFHGAIFIKGSRRHALEALLGCGMATGHAAGEVAA